MRMANRWSSADGPMMIKTTKLYAHKVRIKRDSSRPIRTLVFTILAVIAAGCSRTIDLVLPKTGALELLIYSKGSPIAACQLKPDSFEFQELQKLILSNRDGWSPTLVTYAPVVYVRGSDMSFNFRQDVTVVNYDGGQFERPIPKSEYAFLKCPLGT